jgi:putative flippase GtrA
VTSIAKVFGQLRSRYSALVAFALAGLASVGVGYLVFWIALIVVKDSLGYIGALVISFMIMNTVTYFLFGRLVFRRKVTAFAGSGKYLLSQLTLFSINAASLFFVVEAFGLNPLIGQLLLIPPLGALAFELHKRFSFRS